LVAIDHIVATAAVQTIGANRRAPGNTDVNRTGKNDRDRRRIGNRIAATEIKKTAQLFYLAPFSSDMNPIEMAFSKLKAALRAQPARIIDTL
jgi:transposase